MHRLGCNKTLGISISQGYGEGFKTNRFLSLELLVGNNLYYLNSCREKPGELIICCWVYLQGVLENIFKTSTCYFSYHIYHFWLLTEGLQQPRLCLDFIECASSAYKKVIFFNGYYGMEVLLLSDSVGAWNPNIFGGYPLPSRKITRNSKYDSVRKPSTLVVYTIPCFFFF